MDLSHKQIEEEFRRQVFLCSGVGAKRMREILNEQWASGDPAWHDCPKCGERISFRDFHVCTDSPIVKHIIQQSSEDSR